MRTEISSFPTATRRVRPMTKRAHEECVPAKSRQYVALGAVAFILHAKNYPDLVAGIS
jgi:hypothetical protein